MKMTKQHFEFIAKVVRRAKYLENYQLEILALDFASSLAKTNENFDPDKFLEACEVE